MLNKHIRKYKYKNIPCDGNAGIYHRTFPNNYTNEHVSVPQIEKNEQFSFFLFIYNNNDHGQNFICRSKSFMYVIGSLNRQHYCSAVLVIVVLRGNILKNIITMVPFGMFAFGILLILDLCSAVYTLNQHCTWQSSRRLKTWRAKLKDTVRLRIISV